MPTRTTLNQDLNATYGLAPSKLEDIDYAVYNYLNDSLNIFCESNEGFRKVPVIFAGKERSYDIKADPTLRSDDDNLLEYPLISIVKTTFNQDPAKKGRYGVHVPPFFNVYPRGSIPIARQVVQEESRDRANATAIRRYGDGTDTTYQTFPFDNKEVVYETLYVNMPAFVEITYEVKVITNYRQQMNQILAPFMSRHPTPAVFPITYEGHSYEAFLDPSWSAEGNSAALDTGERIFKSTTTMRVLGHIITGQENERVPSVIRTQSAAKVTMGRERTIVGDAPEFHADRKDKYRR